MAPNLCPQKGYGNMNVYAIANSSVFFQIMEIVLVKLKKYLHLHKATMKKQI